MNLIRDIRLLESSEPNEDYHATPYYCGKIIRYDHMECLDVIQRLLFLLRHRGFGFEDFDHLYVNFTPCVPHGEVRDVNRSNIREFVWLHYVDVGCDVDLFNSWELKDKTVFVLEGIRKAALLKAPEEMREVFTQTFDEVLKQGEYLLIPYRQKENEHYRVEVFTYISDEGDFLPLIRVSDKEGNVVAEQRLRAYSRDEFISQIGTITIGKRSVRIASRKNWYAEYHNLKPIKIAW